MENTYKDEWLLQLFNKYLSQDISDSDFLKKQLIAKQNKIRDVFCYDLEYASDKSILFPDNLDPNSEWLSIMDDVFLCEQFNSCWSNIFNPDVSVITKPMVSYVCQKLNLSIFQCGLVVGFVEQELKIVLHRTISYEFKKFEHSQVDVNDISDLFKQFINQFEDKEYYKCFLLKYPVLARILAVKTGQIIRYLQFFFERWETDCHQLLSKGIIVKAIDILKVDFGMSDPHDGGNTVAIVELVNGEKVVYKPRSLDNDIIFYSMTDWVNERAQSEIIKPLPILSFKTHGWVKYVPKKEFVTQSEVERYFQRLGGLNALFHFLCATDMHPSNLIQYGEYAVPIDFECLLSPINHLNRSPFYNFQTIGTCAYTGLSPYWKVTRNRQHAWYSYGISDSERLKVLPDEVNADNEEFKVRLEYQVSEYAYGIHYDSKTVSPQNFQAFFIEGFKQVYKLFIENKHELLDDNSPLKSFKGIEARAVLRKTKDYRDTLFFLLAPDNLQSIHYQWVASERISSHNPLGNKYSELLKYERESLIDRDVPIFYGKSDSCNIYDSVGNKYPNAIETSPYDQMMERISKASELDLKWQIEILSTSYKMIAVSNNNAEKANSDWAISNIEDDLNFAIQELAQDLIALALNTDYGVTWLDILPVHSKSVDANIVATLPSIYDGGSGIALFLIQYGVSYKDDRAIGLARRAIEFSLHYFIEQFKNIEKVKIHFSVFEGLLSSIYCAVIFQRETGQNELFPQADRLLSALKVEYFQEQPADYTGGLAGCITVLLKMVKNLPAKYEYLYSLSEELGALLAQKLEQNPIKKNGIAHGNSGIALAYFYLWKETEDAKWHQLFTDYLELELAYISKILSIPNQDLDNSVFWWCRGLPGIGMAMLEFMEGYNEELLKCQINEIAEKIITSSRLSQHHICCGESGKVLFLDMAGKKLKVERWRNEAKKAMSEILTIYKQTGKWHHHSLWEGNQIPSFMSGSSGIAFSMLKILSPNKEFSPLVFD